MPGPGRKKSKAKSRPSEARVDWPLAPDALPWNVRAEFICDLLDVPGDRVIPAATY